MPAAPTSTPITATTPNRIVFDAGAFYKSWDAAPVLIGATRGGAVVEFDREDREIEVDGLKGATKGLVRPIRTDVRLTVTFLEISNALFKELLRQIVLTSDPGVYKIATPDLTIANADYASNYALVATVSGGAANCVFVLKNGLSRGAWNLTTEDRNEGTLGPCVFQAHYDPAATTTVPFEIRWPIGAS